MDSNKDARRAIIASADKLGLIETKDGTQKVYHPVSILYI